MSALDVITQMLQDNRDTRSMELFNKPEVELQIGEIQLLNDYIRDLNNPEWKEIVFGTPTGYEISNVGTVRIKGHIQTIPIQPARDHGYPYVYICGKILDIHRLVAKYFIPNPEFKPQVNHINGNHNLAWYRNLEWVTMKENLDHAIRTGLIKTGSACSYATHTEEQARLVCELLASGMSIKSIEKQTHLSASFIIGIKYRGEWKQVSSEYTISETTRVLAPDTVHDICNALSNGYTTMDIVRQYHVSYNAVKDIRLGRTWRRISNQYNIPGLEPCKLYKLSDQIYDLFDQGIIDSDEIIYRLSISDTKSHRKYISRLRCKYYR